MGAATLANYGPVHVVKQDDVQLNTSAADADQSVGRIYWDDTNKTVAVDLTAEGGGNDVTLQVGQESHIYAKNTSGSDITNGQVVRISGASGNRVVVGLAIADTLTNGKAVAVATHDVDNNDFGYFTTFGCVRGINTNSFTEGDLLYLSASSAGGLTATAPTGTNVVTEIGVVTNKSATQGELHVRIDSPETAVHHALAQATTVAAQDTALGLGTANSPLFAGVVLPKTHSTGLKVDHAAPTFGWKDLVGQIVPRTGAAATPAPALAAFRGTKILSYAFNVNDLIDQMIFHMPHDYVPNSQVFIHLHWGHNGTAISGTFAGNFYVTYCKGYNQASQTFNSELTLPWSVSITNVSGHPRWAHNIKEIELSNAGGDTTHLDQGLLEVDGLIMCALDVTTVPTITGSANQNLPFIFTCDLHYQSTQMATKDKNYPFYT